MIESARAELGDDAVAGLWSFAVQWLAARAAHEINNALNGALVNVEVVRARARPGADAERVADFATAAAEELESTATLVAALLAFARAPRGAADLAAIARDAIVLVGPAALRAGVRVELDGARSAVVGGDAAAARLAVVAALRCAIEPSIGASKDESAGTDSAMEPTRLVRCIIPAVDRPVVEIVHGSDAVLPPDVERVLARCGIDVTSAAGSLTLAFQPTAAT